MAFDDSVEDTGPKAQGKHIGLCICGTLANRRHDVV